MARTKLTAQQHVIWRSARKIARQGFKHDEAPLSLGELLIRLIHEIPDYASLDTALDALIPTLHAAVEYIKHPLRIEDFYELASLVAVLLALALHTPYYRRPADRQPFAQDLRDVEAHLVSLCSYCMPSQHVPCWTLRLVIHVLLRKPQSLGAILNLNWKSFYCQLSSALAERTQRRTEAVDPGERLKGLRALHRAIRQAQDFGLFTGVDETRAGTSAASDARAPGIHDESGYDSPSASGSDAPQVGVELIFQATTRTLGLGEQRRLKTALPSLDLFSVLEPDDVVGLCRHNALLCVWLFESLFRLSAGDDAAATTEAARRARAERRKQLARLVTNLEALDVEPRSYDLLARLLRSEVRDPGYIGEPGSHDGDPLQEEEEEGEEGALDDDEDDVDGPETDTDDEGEFEATSLASLVRRHALRGFVAKALYEIEVLRLRTSRDVMNERGGEFVARLALRLPRGPASRVPKTGDRHGDEDGDGEGLDEGAEAVWGYVDERFLSRLVARLEDLDDRLVAQYAAAPPSSEQRTTSGRRRALGRLVRDGVDAATSHEVGAFLGFVDFVARARLLHPPSTRTTARSRATDAPSPRPSAQRGTAPPRSDSDTARTDERRPPESASQRRRRLWRRREARRQESLLFYELRAFALESARLRGASELLELLV